MDLKVILTNNGGDLVKNPKDLALVFGFENMILLAMFGGNVEENTPTERVPNQAYQDWWGNNLLLPKNASRQFNSDTERTINTVALNSSGISQIEEAVKRDLDFMTQFARVRVQVRLTDVDRIAIGIQVEQKVLIYIWDNTNKELIDGNFVMSQRLEADSIFDEFFDFSFE